MTNTNKSPASKRGAIYFLMAVVARMPLGLSRAVGRGLGSLLWYLNSREAKVTKRNLALCFPDMPEDQRRNLAKQSLQQTGVMLMETPAVWMRDMAWLKSKVVAVEGGELLDEALAKGKGMVLIAPHLGNWEVVGLYAATLGPITSLFEPPKNAEVGAIIQHSREKSGANLVPTDRRGVMKLLKAIKAGGISGILPDQVPNDGAGELVEFFGRPAYTMTLLCNLVNKTGCEALLSYAQRVPGGFKLVFEKPCPELYSEDTEVSLRAMNRTVEEAVKSLPAQYQWEYKRFKCFEEGYQDPYTNLS